MIHRRIVAAAQKNKKNIAVVDKALGRSFTNGDLLNVAYLLAGEFSQTKDRYVGIMLPTTFAAMAANLGAHLVTHADILLALWDGTDNGLVGGTADVVDYAKSQNKPIKHLQVERKNI